MKHPHNQESIDVAPMLEHYVKEHTAQVKEDTKRKLKYEDCCNYCDVHHDNRLSAGKQRQIQAWTSTVNNNMANINRISSAKSLSKEKPVLKFLKYSPPGVPDTDDGFRRIHVPGYINESKKSNFHPSNKSGMKKTNDSHISHFQNRDIKSAKSVRSTKPKQLDKNGILKDKTITEDNYFRSKSTVTFTDTITPDSTSSQNTSSDNTPRNTQLGARTTSNNLLNVFSIDDSFRRHRGTLASSSPWMGSKIVQQEKTLNEMDSEKRSAYITESLDSPKVQLPSNGTQTLKQDSSQTLSGDIKNDTLTEKIDGEKIQDSVDSVSNNAVTKGFGNLENTTEATNSCAYKGLYKFDKSCGQPLVKSEGSKRFQKLNNHLHKMVEEFHLNGTALSVKMKQRKTGVSSDTSSLRSRPQSGTSISSSVSQNKSKLGTRVRQIIPEDNSNCDDGRESFLEMIMDMDQRKSGGKGEVQMHNYLYV